MSSPFHKSSVNHLTDSYGSFFKGCFKYALMPFTLPAELIMKDNDSTEALIVTIAAYAFFTLVVPVIPIVAGFVLNVLAAAIGLAFASMLFTYPVALCEDAMDAESSFAFN